MSTESTLLIAAPDTGSPSRVTPYLRPALWLGLLLAGQAASLQLIEAGTPVRYQHYLPPTRLVTDAPPAALAVLAIQTAVVLVGLWSVWPVIRGWLRARFRAWQLLLVGTVFILTSAAVSRDVGGFAVELLTASSIQAVHLATVVLLVCSIPAEALASTRRLWTRTLAHDSRTDSIVLGLAVWTVLVTACLNWFSYERHPHVPDEVVYLLHAQYFAEGRLSLPALAVPAAFDVDLMHYDEDRWFCPVPPGWPAILSLGVRLGVPWLVNPLLAGVSVILTFALLRRLYDQPTALIAVLLLCTSPWFLFTSMSFMTHASTLAFALAAAVGVAKARETGRSVWAWAAGAAVGVVSLIRPLDGVMVAVVLGLWAVGVGGRRLTWPSLAGFVVGTALVGGCVFPYNAALTGNPLRFPINAYIDKYHGPGLNDLGFGPNRGLGWGLDPFPGHGPLDASINAQLNLSAINVELFGWGTGCLLLVALLLVKGPLRREDVLLLGVIAFVVGVQSLYWYSGGPDFGARYWYLALVPWVALSARGAQAVARMAGENGTGEARVAVGLAALSLAALVCFVPWRAIDKYHHFRGMRPDVRDLARQTPFGRSLVLVRGARHPDYASAAVYNPADPTGDCPGPVYAWDRDDTTRAAVLKAYPGRPVWLLDGPSVTGAGYRVAAGPLPREPAPGDRLTRR